MMLPRVLDDDAHEIALPARTHAKLMQNSFNTSAVFPRSDTKAASALKRASYGVSTLQLVAGVAVIFCPFSDAP